MLAELFKPAWKSRSVEKRRQAITEMDSTDNEHQQILLQLAAEDENSSIRIAAIQQINSVAALHQLSISLSDDANRIEAQKRIDELLTANDTLDEAQYSDLFTRHPDLQWRIAAHAHAPAARINAIQALPCGQLLDVLGATVYTDCRQLIAEKLTDIEDLESARKILRGKDKSAERIIKNRIDTIRGHERQLAENAARVEKLIDEVEYLASHDWLPEFKARCLAHRPQWDNLAFDIDDDARQRYQIARQTLDARLEHQQLIEHTRQAQQQLPGELETLIQATAERDLAASIKAQSLLTSQYQQLSADWQALAEVSPPDELLLVPFGKMLRALQAATDFVVKVAEVNRDKGEENQNQNQNQEDNQRSDNSRQLETALKNLDWPADFPALQVATEIERQLAHRREARQAIAEAYAQKLAAAHKNISAVFRFSRAGNLARARQIAQKVEKALAQFGEKDRLALQTRFDDASQTLGDMDDWKNFATEPKYLELCEAMELLTTSKQHPDKRSSEMKVLQQQWKTLGHSAISDQYWPRFKLAADQVYQPCAEFFEQRRKTRQANLEQRQQFVEQMRELFQATDWDNNPDYKMAQSRVRSLIDSFTQIKDVERNAGQKQWKQLSKFRDAVTAKLDQVYDANIALKQQLIEQTQALAEADARIENLAVLKTLQTRWGQIGITRRNQDQKAWTAFKKQGDIVYASVQALRQGQREETDQQLNTYRDLIKQIQKLARTATDLADADQQFTILQASYAALPELPRELPEKLLEGIQRDYRNACDLYDNSHTRIIKNRHNRQIDALRQKANLCVQLEALGTSPSDQKLQDIALQWDSIELHQTELARRIEARRNTAQSTLDRAEIGAQRRLLCIQLEIAMGVETPEEDRSLRRQYQIEQMNQSGLGQQPTMSKELLENMEIDWLCMPGTDAALQKTLDERFRRVLQSA